MTREQIVEIADALVETVCGGWMPSGSFGISVLGIETRLEVHSPAAEYLADAQDKVRAAIIEQLTKKFTRPLEPKA